MKIVGKILLIAFVAFYFLPSPVVAMASEDLPTSPAVKGTRAVNGYICVSDERPPYPHPDNPYKTYHTVLSDYFLEQHSNPLYQFPTSGDNVIELGEYRIDRDMHLGSGDDGNVFLARHVPTGIYAAAKSRAMIYGREEYYDEYKRLTVLGQLYAAWIKEKDVNDSSYDGYSYAYLIIPFIDGKQISKYSNSRGSLPWMKTTLEGTQLQFSDLTAGLKLVRSMADQLKYITKKGALHDQEAVNILVTNDYQNVVLVDFGSSGDLSRSNSTDLPPFDASKFSVLVYAYCCNYILGTKEYFNDLKEGGEIVEPLPIVKFLRAINTDHWNLKLDPFLTALKTLEDENSN
jgi:hypothetical protein